MAALNDRHHSIAAMDKITFTLYYTWAKYNVHVYDCFDSSLVEHCTGIAEVVCSNPAQSLKKISGLCSKCYSRTCINGHHHSVATMDKIAFTS